MERTYQITQVTQELNIENSKEKKRPDGHSDNFSILLQSFTTIHGIPYWKSQIGGWDTVDKDYLSLVTEEFLL